MDSGSVVIRRLARDSRLEAAAWQDIETLCCRTADDGREIAVDRWEFFARVWIDPYKKLVPDWSYVALATGRVVGYLTGCPDTQAFTRARYWKVAFPLVLKVARGRYSYWGNRDCRIFVRRFLRLDSWPEEQFPRDVKALVQTSFPAHLHINIDSAHRRTGVGSRLMERYLADLRAAAVAGVHLYCGRGPLDFYRRHGFAEIGSIFFHGAPVYALARRLAK